MSKKELAGKILSALSSCRSLSCPHHARDTELPRFVDYRNNSSSSVIPDYAFEMVCSTIRFGIGVTEEIGMDLENMGAKNTLIITDPTVVNLSPFKTVANTLTRHKLKFAVFDRSKIEPTDTSFMEAIDFAKSKNFDSFVAVGGGSVMDTTKAAAIYSANPENEFLDLVCKPFGKQLNPKRPMHPVIAVPTTSGTGSETTTVAVFDMESTNTKSAIRSRTIKPHLALVDPLNVKQLPRHVAIYTGFDVLCHALESYTAKPFNQRKPRPQNPALRPVYQGSNPISDIWARQSLEIVRKYFRRAVEDPEDMEARSQMLLASTFAGMGFGNAGVHLCHGLSYPISVQGKNFWSPDYPPDHPLIPHGLSVVMTACADFKFTAEACPERHLEAAEFLGFQSSKERVNLTGDSGEILADLIKGYMSDFKVANGLKACGFDAGSVPSLANAALNSVSALNLAPKDQTEEQLAKLYEDSLTVY